MSPLFEHSATTTVRGVQYTINAAPDLVAQLAAVGTGNRVDDLRALLKRGLAIVLGAEQAAAFLATSPTDAEIAQLHEAAGEASGRTVLASRTPMNRAARRAAARSRA
ncbi:hypothetical protein [Leifsonia sp. AG29]|uniref:hypothetical protein n=1 Tax=Leifsonia sp. AG29 TaxID=2598860 RepID=UPI00131C4190|nr:hypothetical protein [Leifsonia sp. AG29]